MSTIVLGCDDNGYNDAEYQSTVASILEKAGHTVEKCAIESNALQVTVMGVMVKILTVK